VDELAAAHIELREMQRTFDDMAGEPSARQRRIAVPANVADRVKPPIDMRQQHSGALDRDAFHAAGWDVGGAGDGNEAVRNVAHCRHRDCFLAPLLAMTTILPSSRAKRSNLVGLAQFRLKPNILAALSEVIFCKSPFGTPANIRSRNCCDLGKVASACG